MSARANFSSRTSLTPSFPKSFSGVLLNFYKFARISEDLKLLLLSFEELWSFIIFKKGSSNERFQNERLDILL